jgi:glucose-1-phosphatase
MIKLFVFDLGNVIIPFDNRRIAGKLKNASTTGHTEEEIFRDLFDVKSGLINAYEEGFRTSLEFFDEVRAKYGLRCDFAEFKDIWNRIFWENEAVSRIIDTLKRKGIPLFLLSNTNELHFTYITETFPVVSLMDQWILSYEVGAKKPKQAMYDAIFTRMDVKPQEIFYIDDVEEYIDHARSLGINGFVFRDAGELREALKDIL